MLQPAPRTGRGVPCWWPRGGPIIVASDIARSEGGGASRRSVQDPGGSSALSKTTTTRAGLCGYRVADGMQTEREDQLRASDAGELTPTDDKCPNRSRRSDLSWPWRGRRGRRRHRQTPWGNGSGTAPATAAVACSSPRRTARGGSWGWRSRARGWQAAGCGWGRTR